MCTLHPGHTTIRLAPYCIPYPKIEGRNVKPVEHHSEWKGHSESAPGWPAHLIYLYFWRFSLLAVGSFIFHRQAPAAPWFLVLSHAIPFLLSHLNPPELSPPYKSILPPGQPSPWHTLCLLLFGSATPWIDIILGWG